MFYEKTCPAIPLTEDQQGVIQQDTVPENHLPDKQMPVCATALRHGLLFLVINALPVEGCSPECVFIPLGHLGSLETELLMFQADFLSNRALRTETTLIFADAHETLPGYTEEFLSSL